MGTSPNNFHTLSSATGHLSRKATPEKPGTRLEHKNALQEDLPQIHLIQLLPTLLGNVRRN